MIHQLEKRRCHDDVMLLCLVIVILVHEGIGKTTQRSSSCLLIFASKVAAVAAAHLRPTTLVNLSFHSLMIHFPFDRLKDSHHAQEVEL